MYHKVCVVLSKISFNIIHQYPSISFKSLSKYLNFMLVVWGVFIKYVFRSTHQKKLTNVQRLNKFYFAKPSEYAEQKKYKFTFVSLSSFMWWIRKIIHFFILSCYLTKCPIHHCLQENKRTHCSSDCGPVCVPKKVEK